MEMFCGNEQCSGHTEKRGGRFSYREGRWLCKECAANLFVAEPGKNLYEFDTMHIGKDPNAGPIRVQNLNHLRRLEKQHGVISVAANFDSRNF